jgi:hypothetical protein
VVLVLLRVLLELLLVLVLLQAAQCLLALLWQDQYARKLAHQQQMLIEVFVILAGL